MPLLYRRTRPADAFTHIYIIMYSLLGASACVELNRFEEAITWCDKGLAVSFTAVDSDVQRYP